MGTMRTIEDNNKLIAEFLGYVQPHPDYPNSTYWYKKEESPLTILSFNYDWNWLIQAVIKCKECQFFGSNSLITRLNNSLVQADIELVYEQVIEFINYYNRQQNEN